MQFPMTTVGIQSYFSKRILYLGKDENWKPKRQQPTRAWSVKKGIWFWKATIGYCNFTSSPISMRLHLHWQSFISPLSNMDPCIHSPIYSRTKNSKGLSFFHYTDPSNCCTITHSAETHEHQSRSCEDSFWISDNSPGWEQKIVGLH